MPITLVQQVYNRGHSIDLLCMTGKPGVKMSDITDRIRSVTAEQLRDAAATIAGRYSRLTFL